MRLHGSFLMAALVAFSLSLPAQHDMGHEEEEADTIALFPEALGSLSRTISTDNALAQAYFDQGLQLKYAFAVHEAALSFKVATQLDTNCAICYWAEAWARGAYLNGSMREDDAPKAYAAIQKAKGLARKHATPVERALIEAALPRFVQEYDPDNRREQDSLYSISMQEVYDRFPDDVDVGCIYAEALFLLEPRRGTRDLNDPKVQRIHKVLERILEKDITHPGACHLYIHATESTERPDLGESCADYLGSAIPGASHINHMPSHTWNEVGRWGESVRANLQAWHSDQKSDYGEGIAIYPSHNLHMLLFAASYDGQGAIAIQAAKDYAKGVNEMYTALTLLRFGRFDEILELADRPERGIPGSLWDFARGYAHLRQGEADFAQVYLKRLMYEADTSGASFRGHPAEKLLGIVGHILKGELFHEAGRRDSARLAFEMAVMLEDSLEYDEPEALPFSARHWLGAFLLEMEDYAAAEIVYRAELEHHPHNGWSLYGLVEALAAQGKDSTEEQADFEASWARADHYIRASRF